MNANQNGTHPTGSIADWLDGFDSFLRAAAEVFTTNRPSDDVLSFIFGENGGLDKLVPHFLTIVTDTSDSDPLGMIYSVTDQLLRTFWGPSNGYYNYVGYKSGYGSYYSGLNSQYGSASQTKRPHHAAPHPVFTPSTNTATTSAAGKSEAQTVPEENPEVARLRALLDLRTQERDAANRASEALMELNTQLILRYDQSREWSKTLETNLARHQRALRALRAELDAGIVAAHVRELYNHGMHFRDELLHRLGMMEITPATEFGQHPNTGNLTVSFAAGGVHLVYDCTERRLWQKSVDGLTTMDFVLRVIETANQLIAEQRTTESSTSPEAEDYDMPDQPAEHATTGHCFEVDPEPAPSEQPDDNTIKQARVPSWDDLAHMVRTASKVGGAIVTFARILTGPVPADNSQ